MLFCFVVISALYLSLCSGVHLAALNAGPLHAQELYLKWDGRLFVSIKSVELHPSKSETPADLHTIRRHIAAYLKHVDDGWVGRLDIERLALGDANLSVHYNPRETSRMAWRARNASAHIVLDPFTSQHITTLEGNGTLSDFNATVKAQGVLDLNAAELYVAADMHVAEDIDLQLGIHAEEDALSLAAASARPFKHVGPLVNPFHLSAMTAPWIVERAQGGPLMLHALQTTVPYDDPAKALDNLHAHATFYNARYRFANDPAAFEPAIADKVTLLFEDKKLNIIPDNVTFYGQDGGNTWLNIDFGTPHPLLHLYLDLTARLTPQLHRLIASYGIHLPFVQTKGETRTWLALDVDLETSKTKAKGTFHIDNGEMTFNSLPIAIDDATIDLSDADVTVQSLRASLFDGNVSAAVHGAFNPLHEKGILHFFIDKAQYGTSHTRIEMADGTAPLQMDYIMDPVQDSLHLNESHWVSDNRTIRIGAFTAPFHFGDLNITLPSVPVAVDPLLDATASGRVSLSVPSADIAITLNRFTVGSIRNNESERFRLLADAKMLTFHSEGNTSWVSGNTTISTGSIHLEGTPKKLKLLPVPVTLSGQISGILDGTLDAATLSAELNVSRFHFYDDSLREIFSSDDAFAVYIVPVDEEVDVIVPDLNMLYSTLDQGWKLHFFSLMAFADRSPLLDEYNLTQSSVTVWSDDGALPIDFKGAVEYPYALTIQDGKPVNTYRFRGRFETNDTVTFTVNDAIHVRHTDHTEIRSNGVAFNLSEAVRFYKEHSLSTETNGTQTAPGITIDANNTALIFSDGRQAKADAIKVQYSNNEIYAQLYKGDGGAMLEVKDDTFYLYGNDLDDDFMEHFFNISRFKGGTLDFYVIGNKDKFNGLVKIENTTLYDYVLLNNLFAFINTVPALVTFSLPSYATQGIKIDSAYAELAYNEGNLTISGLKVDSKEMDFAGQGLLNYNQGTMKMQLSVKTQAGDNIRKIPLVGYILVGDDQSVLTTVDVTGPIDNPKISSTIAKDIIVAPFNILKRALDFPIHYLEKIDTNAASSTKKKKITNQITSGTPAYK